MSRGPAGSVLKASVSSFEPCRSIFVHLGISLMGRLCGKTCAQPDTRMLRKRPKRIPRETHDSPRRPRGISREPQESPDRGTKEPRESQGEAKRAPKGPKRAQESPREPETQENPREPEGSPRELQDTQESPREREESRREYQESQSYPSRVSSSCYSSYQASMLLCIYVSMCVCIYAFMCLCLYVPICCLVFSIHLCWKEPKWPPLASHGCLGKPSGPSWRLPLSICILLARSPASENLVKFSGRIESFLYEDFL